MDATASFFTRAILEWYNPNRRPLPWKQETDPYRIWLSEIMLQQTRVEQGLPYYRAFVQAYPTIGDLAEAADDDVMKLWEGLGYYSRARNMLAAARYISRELEGRFPSTYSRILALKGVGPYTAAAIASFAFGLPYAVVDGNVYRVLARFFGIDRPTNTTSGKKHFAQLAGRLLPTEQPARYNQAIMDFGALVCSPRKPACTDCPLQNHCTAFREGRIGELPRKQAKAPRRTRFFHYLIFAQDEQVLIRKRVEKDVWPNLYEFPLFEYEELLTFRGLKSLQDKWPVSGKTLPEQPASVSKPFRQLLSHQDIRARFFEWQLPSGEKLTCPGGQWIRRNDLRNYPLPRIIDWYLADNSLYLKV